MNRPRPGIAPRRIGALAMVVALLVLAGCGAKSSRRPDESVSSSRADLSAPTREPAYNFAIDALDGGTVSLDEFADEWVLVNFWATWCPPCVREMPYLQQIAETREIRVLGINMNESESVVRRFVDEHGITFPILMGADQIVTIAYNARSLPQSYIVAPDGSIALRVIGAVAAEQLDPWLDEQGIELRE